MTVGIKHASFLVLSTALLLALLKPDDIELSNQAMLLASMVLLLGLVSELKDFNFFGLRGTSKTAEDLQRLEGQDPIAESEVRNPSPPQQTPQLMDVDTGNFLALAFEIERLMRHAATILTGEALPLNTPPSKIAKILRERGLLTPSGKEQEEAIRKLRNLFVHGRQYEISTDALNAGLQIASHLYSELFQWLNPQQQQTPPEDSTPPSGS